MFKRLVAVLCVLGLMVSLCACAPIDNKKTVTPQEMTLSLPLTKPNYNNVNNSYTAFCEANGVAFYEDYASSTPGIAMANREQKALLIPAEEFGEEPYIDSTFAVGDRVYAAGSSGYDGETLFYAYDLKTNRYEHLLTVYEMISKWMVTEDFLAYSLYYEEEYGAYPLYVYSFAEGEKQMISEEIEDFGIVDGALRYVAYENDKYHVRQYDFATGNSTALGSFDGYSIKLGVSYQFTSDKVVLYSWEDYSTTEQTKWKVWDLKTGAEQEYTMPYLTYSFIVGEKYAYTMTYEIADEEETSIINAFKGQEGVYPLYRIELATGEYEALPIAEKEVGEFYVASDDTLYLFEYSLSTFFTSRMVVIPYTVSTGEKGEKWIL